MSTSRTWPVLEMNEEGDYPEVPWEFRCGHGDQRPVPAGKPIRSKRLTRPPSAVPNDELAERRAYRPRRTRA